MNIGELTATLGIDTKNLDRAASRFEAALKTIDSGTARMADAGVRMESISRRNAENAKKIGDEYARSAERATEATQELALALNDSALRNPFSAMVDSVNKATNTIVNAVTTSVRSIGNLIVSSVKYIVTTVKAIEKNFNIFIRFPELLAKGLEHATVVLEQFSATTTAVAQKIEDVGNSVVELLKSIDVPTLEPYLEKTVKIVSSTDKVITETASAMSLLTEIVRELGIQMRKFADYVGKTNGALKEFNGEDVGKQYNLMTEDLKSTEVAMADVDEENRQLNLSLDTSAKVVAGSIVVWTKLRNVFESLAGAVFPDIDFSIRGVLNAVKNLTRGILGLGEPTNTVMNKLMMWFRRLVAVQPVMKGIKVAGEFEQLEIGFTTLLKSGEAAKAMLKDLQEFAIKTPFQFQDLTIASERLLALGFTAKQVIPTLTAVGDATAALGGGSARIEAITRALGQMQARGKIVTQEMNQLTEAGIKGWDILSSAIGTSIPEAMRRAEAGLLSSAALMPKIIEGIGKTFQGLMKQQALTILGQWSNIVDRLYFVARDFGMAIKPFIQILLDKVVVPVLDMIGRLVKWFNSLSEGTRNAMMAVFAFYLSFKPLMSIFGGLIGQIGRMIVATAIFSAMGTSLTSVLGGIFKSGVATTTVLWGIGKALVYVITALGLGGGAIRTMAVSMMLLGGRAAPLFSKIGNAILNFVATMILASKRIVIFGIDVGKVLATITGLFITLWTKAKVALGGVAASSAGAAVGLKSILKVEVVGFFGGLLTGVLKFIAKLSIWLFYFITLVNIIRKSEVATNATVYAFKSWAAALGSVVSLMKELIGLIPQVVEGVKKFPVIADTIWVISKLIENTVATIMQAIGDLGTMVRLVLESITIAITTGNWDAAVRHFLDGISSMIAGYQKFKDEQLKSWGARWDTKPMEDALKKFEGESWGPTKVVTDWRKDFEGLADLVRKLETKVKNAGLNIQELGATSSKTLQEQIDAANKQYAREVTVGVGVLQQGPKQGTTVFNFQNPRAPLEKQRDIYTKALEIQKEYWDAMASGAETGTLNISARIGYLQKKYQSLSESMKDAAAVEFKPEVLAPLAQELSMLNRLKASYEKLPDLIEDVKDQTIFDTTSPLGASLREFESRLRMLNDKIAKGPTVGTTAIAPEMLTAQEEQLQAWKNEKKELEGRSALLLKALQQQTAFNALTEEQIKKLGGSEAANLRILETVRKTADILKTYAKNAEPWVEVQREMAKGGIPSAWDPQIIQNGLDKAQQMAQLRNELYNQDKQSLALQNATKQLQIEQQILDLTVPMSQAEEQTLQYKQFELKYAIEESQVRLEAAQKIFDIETQRKAYEAKGILAPDIAQALQAQLQKIDDEMVRDISDIATRRSVEMASIHKTQYLKIIGTVRDISRDMFDSIVRSGKGAFGGLLDWLRDFFIGKLRTIFENFMSSIFTPTKGGNWFTQLFEGLIPNWKGAAANVGVRQIPAAQTGGFVRVHDNEVILDRSQTDYLTRWLSALSSGKQSASTANVALTVKIPSQTKTTGGGWLLEQLGLVPSKEHLEGAKGLAKALLQDYQNAMNWLGNVPVLLRQKMALPELPSTARPVEQMTKEEQIAHLMSPGFQDAMNRRLEGFIGTGSISKLLKESDLPAAVKSAALKVQLVLPRASEIARKTNFIPWDEWPEGWSNAMAKFRPILNRIDFTNPPAGARIGDLSEVDSMASSLIHEIRHAFDFRQFTSKYAISDESIVSMTSQKSLLDAMDSLVELPKWTASRAAALKVPTFSMYAESKAYDAELAFFKRLQGPTADISRLFPAAIPPMAGFQLGGLQTGEVNTKPLQEVIDKLIGFRFKPLQFDYTGFAGPMGPPTPTAPTGMPVGMSIPGLNRTVQQTLGFTFNNLSNMMADAIINKDILKVPEQGLTEQHMLERMASFQNKLPGFGMAGMGFLKPDVFKEYARYVNLDEMTQRTTIAGMPNVASLGSRGFIDEFGKFIKFQRMITHEDFLKKASSEYPRISRSPAFRSADMEVDRLTELLAAEKLMKVWNIPPRRVSGFDRELEGELAIQTGAPPTEEMIRSLSRLYSRTGAPNLLYGFTGGRERTFDYASGQGAWAKMMRDKDRAYGLTMGGLFPPVATLGGMLGEKKTSGYEGERALSKFTNDIEKLDFSKFDLFNVELDKVTNKMPDLQKVADKMGGAGWVEVMSEQFTELSNTAEQTQKSFKGFKLEPLNKFVAGFTGATTSVTGFGTATGDATDKLLTWTTTVSSTMEKVKTIMAPLKTSLSSELSKLIPELPIPIPGYSNKGWVGPDIFSQTVGDNLKKGSWFSNLTGITGLWSGKGGGGFFESKSPTGGVNKGVGGIGGQMMQAGGMMMFMDALMSRPKGGAYQVASAGRYAEAIGGGAMAGFAIGGPVGAGVGAIVGAISQGVKSMVTAIKGKNAYQAGAMEVARDFGDIQMTADDLKKFWDEVGISEEKAYSIRKDLLSSPLFLSTIAAPLAKEQGRMDELIADLKSVKTAWGTFDFSRAFKIGDITGDWSLLNQQFMDAFKNSSELQKMLPDWQTKLAATGDAMKDVTDFGQFKALYTAIKDTIAPTKTMYTTFVETGEITEEFRAKIVELGGDISKFQAVADLVKLNKDFADLTDTWRETLKISPEFRKMYQELGGDMAVLDAAEALPGLQKNLDFMNELTGAIEGIGDALDPIQEFLKGNMTANVVDAFKKAGLDPDKLAQMSPLLQIAANWEQATNDFFNGTRKVWDETYGSWRNAPIGMPKGGTLEKGLLQYGGVAGQTAVERYRQGKGFNMITPELLLSTRQAMQTDLEKQQKLALDYIGTAVTETTAQMKTLTTAMETQLTKINTTIENQINDAKLALMGTLTDILVALYDVGNAIVGVTGATNPIVWTGKPLPEPPPGSEEEERATGWSSRYPTIGTTGNWSVKGAAAFANAKEAWNAISVGAGGQQVVVQNCYISGWDDFVAQVKKAGIDLRRRGNKS